MIKNSHSISTPSQWRRVLCSLFFIAAALAAVAAIASSPAVGQGRIPVSVTGATASKIAPWVAEHTANGQQAEFFVVLADQADISAAASLPTKIEKGRYVYNTLCGQWFWAASLVIVVSFLSGQTK
jgi:hypothetical protein